MSKENSYNKNKKAFTLIEVIMALFITAILIGSLSVAFNTSIRSYRQAKDLLNIIKKAELLISQMTMELKGAVVQEYLGVNYITFVGSAQSLYFMAPVENSTNVDLCELGYLYDSGDEEINRHYVTSDAASYYEYMSAQNLGRVDYTTGQRISFVTNVSDFQLRYRDPGGAWSTTWTNTDSLPALVEVNVEVFGEYPEDDPEQSKTFTSWIYLPNSRDNS